jgi:hypothetical protein
MRQRSETQLNSAAKLRTTVQRPLPWLVCKSSSANFSIAFPLQVEIPLMSTMRRFLFPGLKNQSNNTPLEVTVFVLSLGLAQTFSKGFEKVQLQVQSSSLLGAPACPF